MQKGKTVQLKETHLYRPVHDYLEAQGYSVRSEVNGCDITATKDDELVIVELKLAFSTSLLVQAAQRQRITEAVYIALPKPSAKERRARWRGILHLLRRLELGLIFVTMTKKISEVEIILHPLPYDKKKNTRGRRVILREIAGRSLDHNEGGSTRQKILTAYRESAIFIACCLKKYGPLAPRQLRAMGTGEKTQSILASNFYGWFERIDKGIYGLKPKGAGALKEYPALVKQLRRKLGKAAEQLRNE